eukprot:TRINITY_DN2192_c1_g1_i4.p1 TRINITY_DN2192_c1_g1~~TRINITY_DN2192_c1_g1_i4.p1  ORF type:complete len:155 (-),score=13.51 TRINITY_DN2192_c1_g1_i4:90-554(-)
MIISFRHYHSVITCFLSVSFTPSLHHSITPSLPHSITPSPSPHHSITHSSLFPFPHSLTLNHPLLFFPFPSHSLPPSLTVIPPMFPENAMANKRALRNGSSADRSFSTGWTRETHRTDVATFEIHMLKNTPSEMIAKRTVMTDDDQINAAPQYH